MPARKMDLLTARSAGDIVNDTGEFITRNFMRYSKAFLLFVAPPMLVGIWLVQGLTSGLQQMVFPFAGSGQLRETLKMNFGEGIVVALLFSLLWLLVWLLQGSLSIQFLLLYESTEDPMALRPPLLWAAISRNFRRMLGSVLAFYGLVILPAMAAAGLLLLLFIFKPLYGLLCMPALCLLAVYLAVPLSNYLFVRLREGLGVFESLQRCFELNHGRWGQSFGGLALVAFIAGVVQVFCMAPFNIANLVLLIHHAGQLSTDTTGLFTPLTGLSQGLTIALGLFFSSVNYFAAGLNYFSLVEQKDHESLRRETEALLQRREQGLGG